MPNFALLNNVRLAYPYLVEPHENVSAESGKKTLKYKATLLADPKGQPVVDFMKVVQALCLDAWKDKKDVFFKQIVSDKRACCFGDGNNRTSQTTGEIYAGHQGMFYLTASSATKPRIMDAEGNPVDEMFYYDEAAKLYSGCRVKAVVEPWVQKPSEKNGNSRGIRCNLIAIQFLADDEPLGSSKELDTDTLAFFKAAGGTPSFLG